MDSRQLELWSVTLVERGERLPSPSLTSNEGCVSLSSTNSSAQPTDSLRELDLAARHYVENARTRRTRVAYTRDMSAFKLWCDALRLEGFPSNSATLARYLTHLARSGRKVSTIRRARIAISMAHADAGLPRPDQDTTIRKLERGMGRIYGTKPSGTMPLMLEDVRRIVGTLGDEPRDDRDRALLLLGFAGAFRSSELAAVRIEHLRFNESGMLVELMPQGAGDNARLQTVTIAYAQSPDLCAVRAVRRWLERIADDSGPLLRSVTHRRILRSQIHPRAISRAVKRLALRAAIRGKYSAHSLRAGLATSACAGGVSEREVQEHGRWRDRRSLDRYIQPTAGQRNLVPTLY